MSMDIPYFNSGSLGIAKRRNAALPNSLVQIAKLQTNPNPYIPDALSRETIIEGFKSSDKMGWTRSKDFMIRTMLLSDLTCSSKRPEDFGDWV